MSPISLSPLVLTASVGVFLSGGGGDDEAVRTASAKSGMESESESNVAAETVLDS